MVNPVFDAWFETNKAEIMQYAMVNMHSLTHSDYFTEKSSKRIELFNAITPYVLVESIKGIFGEGIHFHNTQLFFNPINHSRLPYWHRDMQYNNVDEKALIQEHNNLLSLHVRIPLIDEQGVEVIPGTHRRWDNQHEHQVRMENDGHKNSEDLPGAELISLDVGDVLVFNAQMIHRGNYALNKQRRALDLCVGKYHEFMAGFLDPQILPTKNELSLIKNKLWFENAHQVLKLTDKH